MHNRIKNGVCFGTGDNLTSSLINGKRLYKDSPACDVYSDLEKVKNQLSLILLQPESEILEEYDAYLFRWLKDNLHSLGSYCFFWGDTIKHNFPKELLDSLEGRILHFQSFTSDCKDFVIIEDAYSLLLDNLRILYRDLERAYVKWHRTLFGESVLVGSRGTTAAILNRLSGYQFHLLRYYQLKRGLTEKYWEGEQTSKIGLVFDPPVFK